MAERHAPASAPLDQGLPLDDLIDSSVGHGADLGRVTKRLGDLLEATAEISGELSLELVLLRVVEAARRLVAAEYAALGVRAPDGTLGKFVHVGMDGETVRRIGRLPQGTTGLLGALIAEPRPIRLADVAADPRSAGLPAHHPPLRSFLGVPIRSGGQVFGALFLANSRNGEFGEEDEIVLGFLARAAGGAVANARRYREVEAQQRWLAASVAIESALLDPGGEDPLAMIARYALQNARGDLVSFGVLNGDESEIRVEIAVGRQADLIRGRSFPLPGSLASKAIADRTPLAIRSPEDIVGYVPVMASTLDIGPTMVIPLVGRKRVFGVLNIVRRRGAPAFGAGELDMVAAFAVQAGVAMEMAEAQHDQQRLAVLEDRDRIARDLHDHVIQQLFAVGLSLQYLTNLAGDDPSLTTPLQAGVEDLDRTIRQIRRSIFALRGPLGGGPAGLRRTVLQLSEELTPMLGFSPDVTFAGPLDIVVGDQLADDVVACVREALTNVAKHADARHVFVDLAVTDERLTVHIRDDGKGLPVTAPLSGLRNLRIRAEAHAGSFEARPAEAGGTELHWEAMLP